MPPPCGHPGLGCQLLVLLLAVASTGVSATAAGPAVLCFCLYPPYVYLDPAYDLSVLDDLYLRDLNAEKFNRYFKGHDVELATALAKTFLESDPATRNSTRFRVMASPAQAEWADASTFYNALRSIGAGECDLGLSGFFYTSYREQCDCTPGEPLQPGEAPDFGKICCLDFSHPYDRDGFSFVTKMSARQPDLMRSISSNFNMATLTLICLLVLAIFVSGHVVWAVERHTNSAEFPMKYLDGVDDGMWWSVTTMTTVGYGDKAPITATGRCLGFTWMIVGLMIFGIFNAVFTSALTSAHVKDVILLPRYASQQDGNLHAPELLPICTLGDYEKEILGSYGIDAADIRIETISACYKLLNASTSPPTKANHIGSVFSDRRFFVTDSLPNLYAQLYPDSGAAPLTTISPGVVVNSVLQVRRLAAVLPKGSNLTQVVNEGLAALQDGVTFYSNVAPEYENGWTLDECQTKYLGPSNNPYEPLHVEHPNPKRKPSLTSRAGDIAIITLTVAVSALFLTVQTVGHWRTHFPGSKVLPGEDPREEDEPAPRRTHRRRSRFAHGEDMVKLKHEMAEMRKTLQLMLHVQQQDQDARLPLQKFVDMTSCRP